MGEYIAKYHGFRMEGIDEMRTDGQIGTCGIGIH